MGNILLTDYIQMLPIHSIKVERLENWKKDVKLIAKITLSYVHKLETITDLTIFEKLYLYRLITLLKEWSNVKMEIDELDKDLLENFSYKKTLWGLDDIVDPFYLAYSQDSYLLFTHLFRYLKDLSIEEDLVAQEAASFITARNYTPFQIDLAASSSYVYGNKIYAECITSSHSSSASLACVRRLYSTSYSASEYSVPLHVLSLLNCVGCLLLSRYRLSRVLSHPQYSSVDTYLIDLIHHLTLGVPHDQT